MIHFLVLNKISECQNNKGNSPTRDTLPFEFKIKDWKWSIL